MNIRSDRAEARGDVGLLPRNYPGRVASGVTAFTVVETAVGTFGVEASTVGVRRVRLSGDRALRGADRDGAGSSVAEAVATQLEEYARGARTGFDVEIDWTGVEPDQRVVLETLLALAPYGSTVTYGELASESGVGDAREIGVHMNRNPLPVVVPCHRVVAADGLGGYGGGLPLKRRLLELEGALPPSLDLGDV